MESINEWLIKSVRVAVKDMVRTDKSGHGIDHIDRVYNLAMCFAEETPGADKTVIALASLLHDIDDYKMVGEEDARELRNARRIMELLGADKKTQDNVLGVISNMGYKNFLRGVRPNSSEGMIVSDADMCDSIGAVGIIRSIQYAISDKGSGCNF